MVEVVRTSISLEGGSFHVVAITQRNVCYKGIFDARTVQAPPDVLSAEYCQRIVKQNQCKFVARYEPANDTIHLSYQFVVADAPCTIVFDPLKCAPREEPDLKVRVNMLEAQLDALQPYETVFAHTYPKWASLDEFKALPDYHFFTAALDPVRFIVKTGTGTEFIKEVNDIRVSFRGTKAERGSHYAKWDPARGSLVDGQPSISTGTPFTPLDRPLEGKHSGIEKYVKSVESPFDPRLLYVLSHVLYYIQDLVTGWCLHKMEAVAFRDVFVDVAIGADNAIHISIRRTKVPRIEREFLQREEPAKTLLYLNPRPSFDKFTWNDIQLF
jgi:hypothetical protein